MGIATIQLICIVPLMILNGWAIKYLWKWFVTPFGLMELSIAHAIGISSIVGYLTYQMTELNDSDSDKLAKLITGILKPFLALIIGRIIYSFM